MSTTAVITGPHGFIGQAVVRTLRDAGYRTVGIGLRGSSHVPDLIEPTLHHESALPDGLEAVLVQEQPELLVHTAAPASVGGSLADPEGDFRGSVGSWVGVLDAVRRTSPDTAVLLISSAAVYGNPAVLPVAETAPVSPVSPYGFHKWMCEIAAEEYHQIYGLRVASARVFSAYGRGLRRQLLWDTCVKLAAKGPLRMFGTGAETRDFVHVDDVASALLLIAEKGVLDARTYNVASGRETSVRGVAEQLVKRIDPGRPIEFTGDSRPGDPIAWRADIREIEALGFRPAWTLEDGVADYAAWFAGLGPHFHVAREAARECRG